MTPAELRRRKVKVSSMAAAGLRALRVAGGVDLEEVELVSAVFSLANQVTDGLLSAEQTSERREQRRALFIDVTLQLLKEIEGATH